MKIASKSRDPEVALYKSKPQKLSALCAARTDVRHYVDLINENKAYRFAVFNSNYELTPGWFKPSVSCPNEFTFEVNGVQEFLVSFDLVKVEDFQSIPRQYLEPASFDDLHSSIGGLMTELAKENPVNTLLWEYDERHLLPSQILIDQFTVDPKVCEPLENMFRLGGVNDISRDVAELKTMSLNKAQNFLDRVAAKTTAHFRSVWKEYRNIEFKLRLDANRIIPAIKEENSFDFSKRSDGFKRFVSFLLMVSVNVKTDQLKNTLLLVDEPDAGLHPSGARFLRDELIRIASKNYVIYSTHSIFMIDVGDIDRHYIVKKKNEITTLIAAKESNVADEEVLYNALGFSLFEVLKQKNIIFEGWRDKRLFQIGLGKASVQSKKLLDGVGICHAKGVKNIRSITPIMDLANRGCIVVSDADAPARDQQKLFKADRSFGDWFTYQQLNDQVTAVTGEDFLKNAHILKHLNVYAEDQGINKITAAKLEKTGKLAAVDKWLKDAGLDAEQTKAALSKIKDAFFDDLSIKDIEDDYSLVLEGLVARLGLNEVKEA